jgi:hypothetical protein
MGTRHLIAAQVDGQYKIAQYGQWDGYPSGQGLTALAFCRTIVDQAARQAFAEKLRATAFVTDEDIEAINAELKATYTGSFKHPMRGEGGKYQQFSRDRGATILRIVADAEPGIKLQNSIGFAGDSLFCEFAYVVDLDKGTFEVFKGFNHNELGAGERFAVPGLELEKTEGYHPIAHLKTYQLDALPDDDTFLAELEPREEEEADEA